MPLKKGDILDEHKRHPDSCGLVMKVMSGGEGFEKVICCDHDLTEEDLVPRVGSTMGRRKGHLLGGLVLDERKLYPDSCGLRVMILDGGEGFREIRCCGHSITMDALRDVKFGKLRGEAPSSQGPAGTA